MSSVSLPATASLRDTWAARPRLAFWGVATAFAIVMASSSLPTPLYTLYRERDGFSTSMITVTFAVYALGVATSLFLAGHLSDAFGRRRTLIPGIAAAAASALIFLVWPALPGLLAARFLCGLGVGVVSATATAYLAELDRVARPDRGPRRAQLVATAANLGGIGSGPLVAGLLSEHTAHPLVVPFALIVPALALGALLVLAAPETRPALRPRPRYRPQRPGLPAGTGGRFAAAAVCGVLSFSVFGMYASIVPSIIAGTLGDSSRVLAGAAAFAVFGCSLLSQLVTRTLPPRRALALGFATTAGGVTVTALSVRLAAPSLALFLAGGMLAGAGAGLLFRGGLTAVVELSSAERRAEGLAGFFLVSYLGLAAPVIAVGIVTQALGAPAALAGFAVLAVVAISAAARPLLRPRVATA
jgi:MFS family permease